MEHLIVILIIVGISFSILGFFTFVIYKSWRKDGENLERVSKYYNDRIDKSRNEYNEYIKIIWKLINPDYPFRNSESSMFAPNTIELQLNHSPQAMSNKERWYYTYYRKKTSEDSLKLIELKIIEYYATFEKADRSLDHYIEFMKSIHYELFILPIHCERLQQTIDEIKHTYI